MRSRFTTSVFVACVAAQANTACNDAGFKSETNNVSPPVALTTTCTGDNNQYLEAEKVLQAPNTETSMRLEVKGEYCPSAAAKLSILFLIDFSLSMYNKEKERGNDQLTEEGSCGRLAAAKAIYDRHKSTLDDNSTEVKVGVIGFSSGIDESVGLTPIADFEDKLDADYFCRGEGNTNYRAVFDAAKEVLEDQEGTKIVYFVTDGLPSMGGEAPNGLAEEHQQAAITAAKALRKEVPDLTLNAVFLGNEFEDVEYDPEAFLSSVTGDEDRVKIVDAAENLAKEILKLEAPKIEIDETTAKAEIVRAGSPTPVTLTSFAASGTRDQVWSFATEPFAPYPNGPVSDVKLVITAQDKKGDDYVIAFDVLLPETSP